MSTALKYVTSTGYAKEYILSVNTPDYENPAPPYSFILNPDVSALAAVPVKYWKVSGGVVVEMTAGEKQAINDAEDVARPPVVYPIFTFHAKDILQCVNADWPINRAVPVLNDPLKESISVMQFDNGVASGIGYYILYPEGMTCLKIEVHGRAATAPATADKTLSFQSRFRVIPDGEAINSWGTETHPVITYPQDAFYHKFTFLKNLAGGNLYGKMLELQFVRRGNVDTLEYPFYLTRLTLRFS